MVVNATGVTESNVSYMGARPIVIVATGHSHGRIELSSGELESTVPGLTDGWSARHLGIRTRRVIPVHERITTYTSSAVRAALRRADWTGDSLDAIICGTSFPDQVNPASAAFVASDINPAALAFDVNAACASFLYGLAVARSLLATEAVLRRVAVCTAEHASAWADYTDSHSSVFWGDSGGAALVTNEPLPGFAVVDVELIGDHRFPEKVFTPRNGTFRSDGKFSFEQVVRLSTVSTKALLERNRLDVADLAAVVPHQSNARLFDAFSSSLGVSTDRFWSNVEWAGNQASSGLLTAFSAGWHARSTELLDGDHVLLVTVGAGYACGATLLRWVT